MSLPSSHITSSTASDMAPGQVTEPADLLRLDLQLCFALYSTSLAMTKVYKPMLAPLGLTYPQYLVMLLLWEQDGRTVNELGQILHLDSGTLTPLLKRLEAQGLVTRQRDAQDERRVRVSLSEQGTTLKLRAADVPAHMACKLALDGDEIGALRAQLNQLRDRLLVDQPPESPSH